MDKSTLASFGAIAAVVIMTVASSNWRRAIKFAFVLVLLEGAIRKWILPSAADLVYFAKDFVILGAYLGVVFKDPFSLRATFPQLPWGVFALCWITICLEVLNPNTGSLICGSLGVRNYLLYVPLAFLVPRLFRTKDEFLRQISIYLVLGIPICLLGCLQFKSDRFSVINTYAQGMADYGAEAFGEAGHARITGTFSYLTGHTTFIAVFFALNVAMLIFKHIPYRFVLTYVSLPLLVGNALMSGSRAVLCVLALVIVVFAINAFINQDAAMQNRYLSLVVAAMLCVAIAIALFPEALAASQDRIRRSEDGLYSRLIELPMENFETAIDRGGVFGNGIGNTAPVVQQARERLGINAPLNHPGLYDFEMAQVAAEIGLFGWLIWYGFRLIFVYELFRNYRYQKDLGFSALSLAALLVAIAHFPLQFVLNHVAGVLVWGLCGLGLGMRFDPVSEQHTVIPRASRAIQNKVGNRMRFV